MIKESLKNELDKQKAEFVHTFYYLPLMAAIMCLVGWVAGVDTFVSGWTVFFAFVTSFVTSILKSLRFVDGEGDTIKGYFNKWNWNSDERIVGKKHIIKRI